VVDERGKVRGFDNLFVADASIMPTIPRANTYIPTLVAAERIVEWLVSTVG
jgi:choline dehydrogenase-like flavoprotein